MMNVGDKIYRYCVRDAQMFVHEGIVKEARNRSARVYLTDSHTNTRCIYDEIGTVDPKSGRSVWLTERDDELAKSILAAYHEKKLIELQEQVSRKIELIKMLKEERP